MSQAVTPKGVRRFKHWKLHERL